MRTPLWGALSSVGLLAACLAPVSLSSAPAAAPAVRGASSVGDTIEWGNVGWERDLDVALEQSVDTGKPVMLLFQEVPG